jgi:hypothetical protein
VGDERVVEVDLERSRGGEGNERLERVGELVPEPGEEGSVVSKVYTGRGFGRGSPAPASSDPTS